MEAGKGEGEELSFSNVCEEHSAQGWFGSSESDQSLSQEVVWS